jgi:hypothetical protein
VDKYNIEKLQEIAKQRSGKLISKDYSTFKKNYLWECKKGHQWKTSLDVILYRNHWCQKCAREKVKLDRYNKLKRIAEHFNGKLLTKFEENKKTGDKYLWECKKGHQWEAPAEWMYYSIKRKNFGCPKCYNEIRSQHRIRYNVDDLNKFVEKLNGKFLSLKVKGMNNKHLWQCEKGHQWEASITNVVYNGTWCLQCNSSKMYKNENKCRQIFEEIFNQSFPCKHPKFLNGLELDGFNENLQLAFEYNGEQHYNIGNFKNIIIDEDKLEKTKIRDKRKILLCENNNIKLVIIPFWIQNNKLKQYIINECNKLGFNI